MFEMKRTLRKQAVILIYASLNSQGMTDFSQEAPHKLVVPFIFLNSIICSDNFCEEDATKSSSEKIPGSDRQ